MMADSSKKFVTTVSGKAGGKTPEKAVELAENPRAFTLWQRFQISVASWIGYLAVLVIGRTLRWHIEGWENWEAANRAGKGIIYTFWHREIFSACWFWRRRGIVVMTSQNFDGEYIARIIQKHGYGASRGSLILSRSTGAAILCFHIALRNAFVFSKSWDQTQFPHPFSRAAILIAPPIVVPHGASEEEQNRKQEEVQNTLDQLRKRGEAWAAAT